MAIFKSQLVTAISGSVGGTTYFPSRGGLAMRGRATPVNPNTPQQQLVRNTVSTLTAAWAATLTQAQRDAWSAYGAATPLLNTLGDSVPQSGLAMYIRGNVGRAQAGLARVDAGPTINGLPAFTAVSATTSNTSPFYTITFTAADAWVNVNSTGLLIYASPDQKPTINFYRRGYRFTDSIDGDATTAPTSPATITSTPFPRTPNNKVFLRVVLVDQMARLSAEQFIESITADS